METLGRGVFFPQEQSGFNSFTPHGDGNSDTSGSDENTNERNVLIPLPLTGMETSYSKNRLGDLLSSFNSFTPHGDGNLGYKYSIIRTAKF